MHFVESPSYKNILKAKILHTLLLLLIIILVHEKNSKGQQQCQLRELYLYAR